MNLLCLIRQVNTKQQSNYFIVVQFRHEIANKSTTFRTDLAVKSATPTFHRNTFLAENLDFDEEGLSLRFRLYSTTLQELPPEMSIVSITVKLPIIKDRSQSCGTASFKIGTNSYNQLQEKGFVEARLPFVVNRQQYGSLFFALKVKSLTSEMQAKFEKTQLSRLFYDPFQEDYQLIQNNIQKLEKIAQEKLKQYEKVRKSLSSLRALEQKVHLDQKMLTQNVQNLEKSNFQKHNKLSDKIKPETIETSFQILKDTAKGQALLVQTSQYLRQRLKMERELQQQLQIAENKLKPFIQKQLKMQEHSQNLRKKIKQQRFQMHRLKYIVEQYNSLVDQIVTNELIIRNLQQKSQKSQLTAKQAMIVLQQARYERDLEKFRRKQQQPQLDSILQKIQLAVKEGYFDDENDEFAQVYEVKLRQLKNQLNLLENKLKSL